MPRKKKSIDTQPEAVKQPPVLPSEPFPDLPPSPSALLGEEFPFEEKKFHELTEEDIQGSLRALLFPFRATIVNRMVEFSTQNQNMQVAERATNKLFERLYGKVATAKEGQTEDDGLAVGMRSELYVREDDIPDGTEKPEGYGELDDDEQALLAEDAAIQEEIEEEEDED